MVAPSSAVMTSLKVVVSIVSIGYRSTSSIEVLSVDVITVSSEPKLVARFHYSKNLHSCTFRTSNCMKFVMANKTTILAQICPLSSGQKCEMFAFLLYKCIYLRLVSIPNVEHIWKHSSAG